MKRLLIIITVILLIATPVLANTNNSYTINHEMVVELDGEWGLTMDVITPAQGNVAIGLDGIGTAYLSSKLLIVAIEQMSSNWYDLF